MIYVFLLIAVIFSMLSVYGVSRTIYSHKGLIRALERSEDLQTLHFVFIMFLSVIVWVTLIACNNTFWHLAFA